jgi:hypothetical protein
MKTQIRKESKIYSRLSLYAKCGAISLLLILSILVVACGGNTQTNTTPVNLNGPVVTVTIKMGNSLASPTPTLPPYWCGAWPAQATPTFNKGKTKVTIYAKFVQNNNGNPQGVDGASATAIVNWADGTTDQLQVTTGTDGLATFTFSTANHDNALNKVSLVTVTFTKTGINQCVVDQDRSAFFTLVNSNNGNGNNNNNNGNNNGNNNNGNNNGNNNNGNNNNNNGNNNNGN